MASERDYEGTELELFQAAVNWKAYWSDKVAPYVRGAALEVGAGLGANIANFRGKSGVQWTLLEPDRAMCEEMSGRARAGQLPPGTEIVCGMLADLPAGRTYDSILYIDVLEHIEDDRAELERAAARLALDWDTRLGGRMAPGSMIQPNRSAWPRHWGTTVFCHRFQQAAMSSSSSKAGRTVVPVRGWRSTI